MNPSTDSAEQPARHAERIRFITNLTFRGDDGLVVEGHTTDVSLSGAFLFTDVIPPAAKVGQGGIVEVLVREGEREFNMTFPCSIARVTERGLGLFFDQQEEEEEDV
ncbi:MAG: PilZ domain-containing protein [Magnetococcales bacterium]|nr:PilZ domain-containing protein [Magnetococcales bacterium]